MEEILRGTSAALARTSKKDQAKQDLAARLGVPVGHILNIDQVIEMIEPSPTKNAMSKNPKGYPPFFIKGHGHSGLYPLAWVDEYLATGKVKGESGYVEGGQPWPPAPPPPPPVDPVSRVWSIRPSRPRNLGKSAHRRSGVAARLKMAGVYPAVSLGR